MGAGGGFLIILALVILSKLLMKEAVVTSLVIIAAKSLIGFFGEGGENGIDWQFLFTISTSAIVGIFIGMVLSKKIDGNKLKPAFGLFVCLFVWWEFISLLKNFFRNKVLYHTKHHP